MADIKQAQQMIPLITCEISFGQMSATWFLVVDALDLDFWVQVNSIEQPIKRNSVSPGNMWDFFPLMIILITHTTKVLDAKTGRLREHHQYYSARWSSLEIFDFCQ